MNSDFAVNSLACDVAPFPAVPMVELTTIEHHVAAFATGARVLLHNLGGKCRSHVLSAEAKMSVGDIEFLPPGRYRWTLDDIEAKYLPETEYGQTRRQVIWEHFKVATETLRQTVPVAAVWIGGSFLSTKAEPSDVDAIYIVPGNAFDALQDDQDRQMVSLFSGGEQLKARGLFVDSYVFHWTPRASSGPQTDPERQELMARGYWDDWLQRHKLDRQVAATDEDALPVRGYVEVVLDGFNS